MKLYYIVNARMPTDKAHGIQIAKTCDALVELGVSIELVVSNRGSGALREVYGLAHTIPLRRIPVFDLQFLGPIGYRLTALQFALGALLYLWGRVLAGEPFLVYTIDMDSFSFAPLVWVPRPLCAEMHSVKKSRPLVRSFFKRAHIIATNSLIAADLQHTFNIPPQRVCVEPNGVDESALHSTVSKDEARAKLNMPRGTPCALYVGRFYEWKGLEILSAVAASSSMPIWVVGGTRDDYERVTKLDGAALHFAGIRPVGEIPLWLAAADILLLLGTAKNNDSYRYTSPMKVFEYLAANRATVASRTPALESIMGETAVFWYESDHAESLARAIREAQTSPNATEKREAGRALAAAHTWRKRTERILAFMQQAKA